MTFLNDAAVNTKIDMVGGGFIYLACPYAHAEPAVRESRYRACCEVTARALERGTPVFSPIVHNHPLVSSHGLDRGWDFWRRFDLPMLRLAQRLWVLGLAGWEGSRGVRAEIEEARKLGLPVILLDVEGAPIREIV